MILKALYDYYDRRGGDIAPMNMAYVSFDYSIVIDADGKFLRLDSLGDDSGLPLLVYRPEERTSSPIPHSFGDNASYVLGLKNVNDNAAFNFSKELDNNRKNLNAFIEDVEKIYEALPGNKFAEAVHLFYANYDLSVLECMRRDPSWSVFIKNLSGNITFGIQGVKGYAANDADIIRYKIDSRVNDNEEMICLITGNKKKPIDTTYSSYIAGGKSNAKLVAINKGFGYDSYGKEQGMNAPISEEAEFKYTTALIEMLSKGSHNNFRLGSRTFVFWASSGSDAARQAEESLFDLLGYADENSDDPNAKIEHARKVFMAIYSGTLVTTLDDRFYILGLAPNSARIAVVYWSETSLKDFAERILRHFDDMEIDTCGYKWPYAGLREMLSTVTLGGKLSDVTPNLADAVAKSIFDGLPYPASLYTSCLRRIRAEQDVKITRAAIIKAYLNRIKSNKNKLTVMLDKENTNPGYLCGRLFAVLVKIQESVNHKQESVNRKNEKSSIQERYMNAASSTPSSVFASILNLSSHHSEKLNPGSKIIYEKIKQEIIDKLPADGFPAHLNLQDQGRFFVGFYHQRQELFKDKSE